MLLLFLIYVLFKNIQWLIQGEVCLVVSKEKIIIKIYSFAQVILT